MRVLREIAAIACILVVGAGMTVGGIFVILEMSARLGSAVHGIEQRNH
jgi:hypothetical protein